MTFTCGLCLQQRGSRKLARLEVSASSGGLRRETLQNTGRLQSSKTGSLYFGYLFPEPEIGSNAFIHGNRLDGSGCELAGFEMRAIARDQEKWPSLIPYGYLLSPRSRYRRFGQSRRTRHSERSSFAICAPVPDIAILTARYGPRIESVPGWGASSRD